MANSKTHADRYRELNNKLSLFLALNNYKAEKISHSALNF